MCKSSVQERANRQFNGKFAIWENNAWAIGDVVRGLPIKAPEQCGPNWCRAYCGVIGITIVRFTNGRHTWHKEQELQADHAAMFNVIDKHHPQIKVLVTQRGVPTGGNHRRPAHSPHTYDQNHQVWGPVTDPIHALRM